jgi:signal transduction histidine kinase
MSLQPEPLHDTHTSDADVHSLRIALAEAQARLAQERAAREAAEHASALKDEFLAIVSHELRSPLGAILGWAHMLRRRGSEEEFQRGLDVIEQSVDVQAKLIEDLLDLGRMASGKIRLDPQLLEPRCFIDSAVEAVRPAAAEKDLRVRKVLDLSVGPVRGDPTRLQQVLSNLLNNAVKFTPSQGSIEIALRKAPGQAVITVADTGIGIAPGFLPHVFERFRQDPATAGGHGGLGLGLAIARHIVELHGGEITAESAGEGRGATFTMRLPLANSNGPIRSDSTGRAWSAQPSGWSS